MKKIIFSTVCLFLISVSSLTVIFYNSDPYQSSSATVASFFLFLLLSIAGMSTLIVSAILKQKKKLDYSNYISVLRRVLLASFGLTGLLILSSLGVLNTLSALTFIIAVILGEFFFLTRKSEKSNE